MVAIAEPVARPEFVHEYKVRAFTQCNTALCCSTASTTLSLQCILVCSCNRIAVVLGVEELYYCSAAPIRGRLQQLNVHTCVTRACLAVHDVTA
jgi:hypothetical protein